MPTVERARHTRHPRRRRSASARGRAWPLIGLAYLLALAPVAPASAAESIVSITDTLDPLTLEIGLGDSVTWRNDDVERHRMRSTSGPDEFDTGNIEAGQSYTHAFTVEGLYRYHDERDDENPAYEGTIVVTGETSPPDATGDTTVDIVNRLYVPASVTVDLGSTVSWDNIDDRAHTVTAYDGSFDSGIFDVGQAYSRTFDAAGVYDYFCILHPDMVGTVTVLGADGSEPPPPDPTPPPDPDPPPPAPPPPPGDVTIFDNGFTPEDLVVDVGSSVTWTNTGVIPHTATDVAGAFDSGILLGGEAFTWTFTSAGTYNYLCTIHPEMVAAVTVQPGDGSSPPPPEPPPDPDPAPPPPPPAPGDVTIFDNGYTPASLEVAVGSTITWTNTGVLPHTVTDVAGSFDSGLVLAGDTYTRTFPSAGTFNYLCTIHPEMVATLFVVDADGSAPPPAPEPVPVPTPTPSPPPPAPGDVTIFDNGYTPASLEVAVGSTITWTNTGVLPHTVTDVAGSFDSGLVLAGDTYTRTFPSAGTFNYLCTIHPEMVATLFVIDADGSAPPAAEPVVGLTTEPPPAPRGPSNVVIGDNYFRPPSISVAVGSTITWTNDGALPHTVTDQGGGFDSGILMPGDSYRRTFQAAGTFSYLCTLHPDMVAAVIVTTEGTPVGTSTGESDGVGRSPDAGTAAPTTDGDQPSVTFSIAAIDLDYDPREAVIEVGTTVLWTNEGAIPHTVTADGLFDSGIMATGDSFAYTFNDQGVFDYLCTLHPGMVGTVVVNLTAAGSSASSQAPDSAIAPIDGPAGAGGRFTPANAITLAVGAIVSVLAIAYLAGTFSEEADELVDAAGRRTA